MKNITKKVFALILAVLMVLSLAACSKSSSTDSETSKAAESKAETASQENDTAGEAEENDLLGRIKQKGVLEIGTEGNWSPWTYHDESDKLVGFDVEIGQAIADYIGVEAHFNETDWDAILAGVDSGRFDTACNGVGYTEERAKKYDFSDAYAYTDTVLVVAADNESIKSAEDLSGKTTANTISSNYATIAESYGATVTGVNTLLDTIEMVTQGRVDATLNAAVSINDYLREHPDAPIKVVCTVTREKVVYPAKKGEDSDRFVEAVNACIAEMKKSGKMAELSNKYFGMDITKD